MSSSSDEKEYLVEWAIEVTAESPEHAARLALLIQRDPVSLALVFTVTDDQGDNSVEVDLLPVERSTPKSEP